VIGVHRSGEVSRDRPARATVRKIRRTYAPGLSERVAGFKRDGARHILDACLQRFGDASALPRGNFAPGRKDPLSCRRGAIDVFRRAARNVASRAAFCWIFNTQYGAGALATRAPPISMAA
jgi:hypothetical protein